MNLGSISGLRHRLIDALEYRDAAYLSYINNDNSSGDEFALQNNKWALNKANREVDRLRKDIAEIYK